MKVSRALMLTAAMVFAPACALENPIQKTTGVSYIRTEWGSSPNVCDINDYQYAFTLRGLDADENTLDRVIVITPEDLRDKTDIQAFEEALEDAGVLDFHNYSLNFVDGIIREIGGLRHLIITRFPEEAAAYKEPSPADAPTGPEPE